MYFLFLLYKIVQYTNYLCYIINTIKGVNMTLVEIKKLIYIKQGVISDTLRAALIQNAHDEYSKMKVDKPFACAVSFVNSTIQNAKYR